MNDMRLITAKCYAVLTTLVIATTSFAQTPSVVPQPNTINGAVGRVYKSVGRDELRLHVFNPDGPAGNTQRSAIVLFFGGGWAQGSVAQFVPQAKHLAQRGMVAIVADYRVLDRHGTTPFEAIADAKAAIRWTRAHSAEFAIDPNRIAAGGGSSGGHIALSAAVFDGFEDAGQDLTVSSKPNALVLFNPVVDSTHGLPAERFGDRGQEGSPLHHLRSGLPPTLIVHGKADTTVPYEDVDRFCAETGKYGNECSLFGYEGATHGFFNPQNADGKWYRETLLEADRFLTRIGYLQGPAPKQIR